MTHFKTGASYRRLNAGVTVLPIEKFNSLSPCNRVKFLTNLVSIGHVLTGDGWCYVFKTR